MRAMDETARVGEGGDEDFHEIPDVVPRRSWWDRPACTMRTEFFKPEKGRYLHPEQHRPITHREAARFQSIPDSFVFKGTKMEKAALTDRALSRFRRREPLQ